MNNIKATVIIPTTKARGPVLYYSVGSVLNQTVKEIEIFIMGDGVDQPTREVIHEIMQKDKRIKFFDHPKDVRRGEIYRHEALTNEAKGEIVCYLTDRDLMLPDHVEKMYKNLRDYNFCSHNCISVLESGEMTFLYKKLFGSFPKNVNKNGGYKNVWFPLSTVGHSLAFYKELPFGWRTTPSYMATDVYMWHQFLCHDNFKLISTIDFTVMYFRRGNHPGWPAVKRAKELKQYFDEIQNPDILAEYRNIVLDNLMHKLVLIKREFFVFRGKPLSKLFNATALRSFWRSIMETSYLNRLTKRW